MSHIKTKILCLGNEFIQQDCLAKEISQDLIRLLPSYDFIYIKDSFELMNYTNQDIIILDVAKNIDKPKILAIDDLKQTSTINAHDLDASFFLQLLNMNVNIIGIPQSYEKEKLINEVKEIISQLPSHSTSKK